MRMRGARMPYRVVPAVAMMTMLAAGVARGQELYRDGDRSLAVSLWGQAWYQFVEDAGGADDVEGAAPDLHDFMVRRVYLSVAGTVTPWLGFFVHLAGDRFGQRGLDQPGLGLGSGFAFRDGWVTLALLEDALKVQAGRMYVPFTRNYGTTSTKALLITDLDWVQGGYRGGIFYPNKVGRDDGVTLWGNVADDRFQYRLMLADGAGDDTGEDGDELRVAGRVSLSLLEPETGWFNSGTYLGERRVLALGAGFDRQRLRLGGTEREYVGWTVDVHYDGPLGAGGLTVEASYIGIDNTANPVNLTGITPGSDAGVVSLKAGYLLPGTAGPGRLQPFGHYQRIDVDGGAPDTEIGGIGFNYILTGHANKFSLELTYVGQEDAAATSLRDRVLLTSQLAFGL